MRQNRWFVIIKMSNFLIVFARNKSTEDEVKFIVSIRQLANNDIKEGLTATPVTR